MDFCFEKTKRFSRELSDAQVQDLLKFSRENLGYKISPQTLFYYGHVFCSTEYSGYGRLAGDLVDAVLRAVCAVSFARAHDQKNFSFLEIGALYGLNFTGLYNIVRAEYKTVSFAAIDLFEGYYGQKHDTALGLPVTEDIFRINLARSQVVAQDVAVFKGSSSDPTIQTSNAHKTFDLIFVDGDHSYEGVKNDVEYYGTLLTPQGLLIIDNYGDAAWPDITRFVDAELLMGSNIHNLSALRKEKIGRTMVFRRLPSATSGMLNKEICP